MTEWHLGHVPGTVIVDKGELDTLRAENEGLRAALEQIVRGWQVGLSAGDLHDIAKEALRQRR